jgi:hypothetical protein
MNEFLFIESTKKNRNGHVSHLLKLNKNNYYEEVSLATGKGLRYGLYFDNIEQIIDYEYKILDVNKERPVMVGRNTRYGKLILDYLKGEIDYEI